MSNSRLLVQLKQELESTQSGSWHEVDAWIAKATPIIQRYYPHDLVYFQRIAVAPPRLVLPRVGGLRSPFKNDASLAFDASNDEATASEQITNYKRIDHTKNKILNFLDGLIVLDTNSIIQGDDGMNELEGLANPILMQGVTFLFNEVKEILAERRKSRADRKEPDDTPVPSTGLQTVEEVLNLKPKEVRLNDINEEIKHCINMIEQYRKNQRYAEAAIQQFGNIFQAPPIKRSELEDAEKSIQEYAQRLKNTIEKVYGHKISIVGLL
ncbi:hypothetical protein [Herpetosiphon geysericola]|uniref:hypothetical protein n=1 Tax=Herpetosiphon geysericola TaxID=70996 RepID=UPI00128E9B40|nr:hypothetical protein [Herpetosiphon geysericola]